MNKKTQEKKLIVTVGPASLKGDLLRDILSNANVIFRINGAHGTIDYIRDVIDFLRDIDSRVEILVDLPGNKIRTKDVPETIQVRKAEKFRLFHSQVNYGAFRNHLKIGDKLIANDGTLNFLVEDIADKYIEFRPLSNGELGNNKGLHIFGIHDKIPFLFEKDYQLLDLAMAKEIAFVGLSYVRNISDINIVVDILAQRNSQVRFIPKVETKSAINNLQEILSVVDVILIDRGDLSSDVGLLKLPYYFDIIVKAAQAKKRKIYVATQFLKNMQDNPVPSVAEVMNLYDVLKNDIDGLQLSDETAIGSFPGECVSFVSEMMAVVAGRRK